MEKLKKSMKRCGALLLAVALLFTFSPGLPVQAKDDEHASQTIQWPSTGMFDANQGKAALTFTLKDAKGNAETGAELSLLQVALATHEDADYQVHFTTPFAGCRDQIFGSSADNSPESLYRQTDQADHAAKLAEYAVQNQIEPVAAAVTGKDGSAEFTHLTLGLYLVVQTGEVDGFLKIAPFLISLPQYTQDEQGTGTWSYQVSSGPKVGLTGISVVDVTGSKSWEDGQNADGLRPSSIRVYLCINEKRTDLYCDVKADADGSWKFRFPQQLRYDQNGDPLRYSVEEYPVPEHYSVSYQGYNIINTHTPSNPPVNPPEPENPPKQFMTLPEGMVLGASIAKKEDPGSVLGENRGRTPETGDTTPLAAAVAEFVFAGVMLTGSIVLIRRKRKQ